MPVLRAALFSQEPYQTGIANDAEFAAWLDLKPAAWSMATGALSGRITLDFDGEASRQTMERLGLNPHRRTPSGMVP